VDFRVTYSGAKRRIILHGLKKENKNEQTGISRFNGFKGRYLRQVKYLPLFSRYRV
jgi:hypothetical protein